MKTLDLTQGSDEWNAARAHYHTASEAPVMMGASNKATRNDLLRMKATGSEQEFSRWVLEVLFERGHQVEEAARPIAEAIIGEDLYPTTGVDDDDYLLASFDGITLLEDVAWECKQWNEAKAAAVREGQIPEEDYYQVIQQLVVSGAEKALYMVTDGTEEGTVYTWKTLGKEDEKTLRAGWAQFDADLAAWQPEPEQQHVTGATPENLPALRIEVQGMVTESNIKQFRDHALAVFQGISTDLQDDQDFADAESTVKWCKDVESRLDAAKDHAQSQMESVDELFRAVDEIREQARQKRLELEKLVKQRKEAIRHEIITERKQALADHVQSLEGSLDGVRLPDTGADFAAAIKGKKTVKSLRDAADQELADAKLRANESAERIRANLSVFRREAEGVEHLFRDLSAIATKPADDFAATVKARIAEHREAEEKRLEAERERIRREEERKAQDANPEPQPEAVLSPEPQAQPEQITRHGRVASPRLEPRNDFERGYVAALHEYAWWRDGVQYVGMGRKTLDEAVRDALSAAA